MRDRRLYYRQLCGNALRSTKQAKDGLLRMAADVGKRYDLVWNFVIRGFESRARAKTKHKLQACKRV